MEDRGETASIVYALMYHVGQPGAVCLGLQSLPGWLTLLVHDLAVLTGGLLQLLQILGGMNASLFGKRHWLFLQVTHIIKVKDSERQM